MQTMDQSLFQLWEKKISKETALANSQAPQELEAWMKGIKIGQDTKILGDEKRGEEWSPANRRFL